MTNFAERNPGENDSALIKNLDERFNKEGFMKLEEMIEDSPMELGLANDSLVPFKSYQLYLDDSVKQDSVTIIGGEVDTTDKSQLISGIGRKVTIRLNK